jgi:asparagine synthetase B (glutamine-hydrolysing)
MVDAFNILTYLASEFIETDLTSFIIGRIRQDDVKRMRELILTKKYLDPVPKGLPLTQRIAARARRRHQRSWLYRYLPSTRIERLRNLIVQAFQPTFDNEEQQ